MTVLNHFDSRGQARMVDVSAKEETPREAVARGEVRMGPATLRLVAEGRAAKGDVLGVARLAGIMAAKETPRLIPLCHPIELTAVALDLQVNESRGVVEIEARVGTVGRTGAEMEALTAVAVAALTVYDMCKAADKGMVIGDIHLARKKGGRSGDFVFEEPERP